MTACLGIVSFSRCEMRRIIYRALRESYGFGVVRSAYVAWREAKPVTMRAYAESR